MSNFDMNDWRPSSNPLTAQHSALDDLFLLQSMPSPPYPYTHVQNTLLECFPITVNKHISHQKRSSAPKWKYRRIPILKSLHPVRQPFVLLDATPVVGCVCTSAGRQMRKLSTPSYVTAVAIVLLCIHLHILACVFLPYANAVSIIISFAAVG